jgi:ubiquinone/menaquinone biosynthesis C-methylase UbiE
MKINLKKIEEMSYVDFMAFLEETNRAPGGKESIRQLVLNSFVNQSSKVLDVGCNTGYCSFEIAHLAKCRVTGIDINKNMIDSANKLLSEDLPIFRDLIDFKVADGQDTRFEENEYDLVMSGGSTVFIPDKLKAFREYERLTKPWGFVGDIIFFYHENPPSKLLEDMNGLMGINIEPWDLKYWKDFYRSTGLEMFYEFGNKMDYKTDCEIKDYVAYMSEKKQGLNKEQIEAIYKKLYPIMKLFNENHKYLSFGVFIMRKRYTPSEPSLFGE